MAALANPELAAAVSEAGALGMVSVGGFTPEKVSEELGMARKRTSHPFGANFLIPEVAYEDLAEIHESVRAASKLARLVEFFYHEPDSSLVNIVHAERALACWQVGSKQEATAAIDAGCDVVVPRASKQEATFAGGLVLLHCWTRSCL